MRWILGTVVATTLVCAATPCATGVALGAETVDITEASFSPNALGAATNVFGNATIGSTSSQVPAPITHVNVYGPAGVTLDLEGSTTCERAQLERVGPQACPRNSRAGTGGGEGIYELAHELVKEPYTLEFFLSDNQPGHVALMILLRGHTPVSIEVYVTATVIKGPAPYGLGFSVEVPLIKVLPEASDASATTAFLKLGSKGATFYKRVHGKRTLEHVKGIVLPKRCPRGGWPVASQFNFQDGSTVMAKRTIPCPK